ncbi:cytochrome o ubiquinol oxidase subunit IV [Falsirhodobacter halotolerans]|uniref:cytochrome o ubiquinol oxidase subunit IV n=1 Tax=Falsirhodobacter halotolerans TaxID=1146892 RepID=UPI001FD2ED57|nr:cytochrome o ubiquinol oxidase subunit IV [Falsirhodobacter halotolerans]MCJ8138292.1 cytochrome o ubiquinol oxidase subunit IV [Falsirhodobacter halotolerans]
MSAEHTAREKRRELRSYLVGFVLAVILTAVAFLVVAAGLPTMTAYGVIAVTALVQVVVHFRFFLHITLKRSTRDDLQLILFTTLIIGLMAGGTIWILDNLHHRMM